MPLFIAKSIQQNLHNKIYRKLSEHQDDTKLYKGTFSILSAYEKNLDAVYMLCLGCRVFIPDPYH